MIGNDMDFEQMETFVCTLTIEDKDVLLSPASATITILDDNNDITVSSPAKGIIIYNIYYIYIMHVEGYMRFALSRPQDKATVNRMLIMYVTNMCKYNYNYILYYTLIGAVLWLNNFLW